MIRFSSQIFFIYILNILMKNFNNSIQQLKITISEIFAAPIKKWLKLQSRSEFGGKITAFFIQTRNYEIYIKKWLNFEILYFL